MTPALSEIIERVEAGKGWHPPTEPFAGETLLADGWQYRDMPEYAKTEQVLELLEFLGDDHIRFLAMSIRGGLVHGQFLISPDGMERMRARLATQEQQG